MKERDEQTSATDRMQAEWECERLVRAFAQLNDDRDHDRLAELFVEDAQFSRPLDPDKPIIGKSAIHRMFCDRPPRLSRHLMGTTVIDVLSPTEAKGRSYLTFLSSTDVDAPRPVQAEPSMVYGHFDDVFVRTPEGWRFKSRRGALVLKTNA